MPASTVSDHNGHHSHSLSGGKPKRAILSGPPAPANVEEQVEFKIFDPNIQGEVIDKAYEANDRGFDATLFNGGSQTPSLWFSASGPTRN
jgi:hypothetical protein